MLIRRNTDTCPACPIAVRAEPEGDAMATVEEILAERALVRSLTPDEREADREVFRKLAAPIPAEWLKTRSGGGNRQLTYITARHAANRLDEAAGPENWEDEYYEAHGVLFCRITITLPSGRRVSKSDAGGFKTMFEGHPSKGIVDQENTDKTGPSDAFKRAAGKFGVARELYGNGVADLDGEQDEPAPAKAAAPKANGKPRAATPEPQAGGPTGRDIIRWAEGEVAQAIGWWQDAGNKGDMGVANHWQLIGHLARKAKEAGLIDYPDNAKPGEKADALATIDPGKVKATAKKYLYEELPTRAALAPSEPAPKTNGRARQSAPASREPGEEG